MEREPTLFDLPRVPAVDDRERKLRRFWAKVRHDGSGCWLWTGQRNKHRGKLQHGQFCWNSKKINAQRASWRLFIGPIPEGLFVCHHCDVPHCVNPAHLFLGTQQDNMDDMKAKGRSPRSRQIGTQNGRARLTESQVVEILADNRRYMDIAAAFGVGTATVSHIKRGATWTHLTGAKR